ncbi:MAG: hypothetical protein IPF41_12700 [Flavobacteriales bacterium]|nr:hypothetical protein [Flavobacteriales bacterium]
MMKHYALALCAGLIGFSLHAQPPCLTTFTTQAGQSLVSAWNAPALPPTTSGNVATTSTAGSPTVTVLSAAGLAVGMAM